MSSSPHQDLLNQALPADDLAVFWQHLADQFGLRPDAPEQDFAAALEAIEARDKFHDIAADGRITRWQDDVIAQHLGSPCRVLDLGCGDGSLLRRLKDDGHQVQGVELDLARVRCCIAAGVPVIQADIDGGLLGFADQDFDVVVLEETLQTLVRPTETLSGMLRVGRRAMVSFPNFGHWRMRLSLLLTGRMPTSRRLPYQWYDTPNIHLLTVADFLDWCHHNNIHVSAGTSLVDGDVRPFGSGDNVMASEVLFVLEQS